MTVFTPIRRGLAKQVAFAEPTPPVGGNDPLLTIVDSIADSGGNTGPRVHMRLIETSGATTITNRGWDTGTGTLSNTDQVKYRLGSLVSGSNNNGRSFAFSGSVSSPPLLTYTDFVSTADFSILMWIQVDRLPLSGSKFILATTGTSGSVAGGFSIEILSDGRLRAWYSDGSPPVHEIVTTGAAIVAGQGHFVGYRQIDGFGRDLWVDGVVPAGGRDTANITSFVAPPSGTFYFFAWPSGSDPFKGLACEVMGFNRGIETNYMATLGARKKDVLELSTIPQQTFETNSSGTIDLVDLGVCNPDSGWTVTVVNDGTTANVLTGFTANGQEIDWTTGGTADAAAPTIKLVKGSTESLTREVPIIVQAPQVAAGFECMESGNGTLVDLGNATNKETVTNLGSTATQPRRYDASGIIARTRWTGSQGCSSPNRSATTEQFLFRWTTDHDGGCVSGGAMYGNVTWHDNYDSGNSHPTWGGTKNFQLYPCGDGGQVFVDRPNQGVKNFTIEGFRDHACWDPYRISTRTRADNITFKGCWSTCVRDDWLQNDGGANCTAEDCLIGDVIGTGVTNSGCWVWYSCTTSGAAANFVTLKNCLVWSSRMYAPGRPRANLAGGYASGAVLKIDKGGAPKMSITNCVIMADIQGISSNNGDPLFGFKPGSSNPSPVTECSDNILIWRDLANRGSYQSLFGDPPPGFTILTGSEGESFWNERVFEWKAAHPNVRRFNISGIAHAFGGKDIDLVDAG